MRRAGALAAAKGAIAALEPPARRGGIALALISFRAGAARLEVPPGAPGGALLGALTALGAGGGTPLRDAARLALELARQPRWRWPRARARLLLFTDGRTSAAPPELAAALVRAPLEVVVVDCELARFRLGGAAALACSLRARCLPVTPGSCSARSSPASSGSTG
jgi:Mg-chelatase subunit ChlD